MSTTAVPSRRSLLQTTIGMKAVMAVTGLVLFGFVVGHMLGNLQVFLGPAKLNAYAAFLKHTPSLLWGTRAVLVVAVILHIASAAALARLSRAARPIPYHTRADVGSSYAGRTMKMSGFILAAFVIYHLLHFTGGQVHPDFIEPDVYHNVIVGFRQVPAAAAYALAVVLLGAHLFHGLWSMFQSLGLAHPRYTPGFKRFAAGFAVLVTAGNLSIPVAVLLGLVGR